MSLNIHGFGLSIVGGWAGRWFGVDGGQILDASLADHAHVERRQVDEKALLNLGQDSVEQRHGVLFVHVGLVVLVADAEAEVGAVAVNGERQLDARGQIVHEVERRSTFGLFVAGEQHVHVIGFLLPNERLLTENLISNLI